MEILTYLTDNSQYCINITNWNNRIEMDAISFNSWNLLHIEVYIEISSRAPTSVYNYNQLYNLITMIESNWKKMLKYFIIKQRFSLIGSSKKNKCVTSKFKHNMNIQNSCKELTDRDKRKWLPTLKRVYFQYVRVKYASLFFTSSQHISKYGLHIQN